MFTKPFKSAWADENNVYFDNGLIKQILHCGKETYKVRSTAWFIVCCVAMELYATPNKPVTYKQIATMGKRTSTNMVKRAHALLIELGVE
jgi:hypothetical protein